jgi:hypothetical protein
VLWRNATAVLVLSTVIKWLQFDSRLLNVFRETGLLHVLIRHCQIFSERERTRTTLLQLHRERSAGDAQVAVVARDAAPELAGLVEEEDAGALGAQKGNRFK